MEWELANFLITRFQALETSGIDKASCKIKQFEGQKGLNSKLI